MRLVNILELSSKDDDNGDIVVRDKDGNIIEIMYNIKLKIKKGEKKKNERD